MLNQSNIYQPGMNQGAGMQNLVPNRSQLQRNPLGENAQSTQMMPPPIQQNPGMNAVRQTLGGVPQAFGNMANYLGQGFQGMVSGPQNATPIPPRLQNQVDAIKNYKQK